MSQECLMSGCQRKFSMENCKKESAHKVAKRNATKTPLKQGSKCPSLPGLTHWVNPGLPGLGFKPYFGKVGNTGE